VIGEMQKMNRKVYAVALGTVLFSAVGGRPAGMRPEPPVCLHPRNPHYFLFRGKAGAFITSGEHYGAVLNADFDYRRYLTTLKADGLNYTRLFGGS